MRRALLDTDIFPEVAKGKNETVRRRALAYTATIGPLAIKGLRNPLTPTDLRWLTRPARVDGLEG